MPVSDPAADELENLRIGANVAGALLQAFQIQLDFLKALEPAPEGLSHAAAERWFTDEIQRRGFDPENAEIPDLLEWMVTRGLLEYTPEGNLKRSMLGDRVSSLAETFWYAAKAV